MAVDVRGADGALVSPPIWVDHNRNPPRLDFPETRHDLERFGISLVEGQRLVLWDADANDDGEVDDLIATGVAFRDEEHRWLAAIVGGEYAHFSDLDESTKALWRRYRPENGEPPVHSVLP